MTNDKCRQYIMDCTVVSYSKLVSEFGKAITNETVWELVERGEIYFDETWKSVVVCEDRRQS